MSAVTCCGIAITFAGMAWITGPKPAWATKIPSEVELIVLLAGPVVALLGLFFTRGRGATIITNLRTGKKTKLRDYYGSGD